MSGDGDRGPAERARAARILRTQRVLWMAMLSAVGGYAVVAVVVEPTAAAPPAPVMAPALAAVALFVTAVSFVLPRVVFRNAARGLDLAVADEIVDAQTPAHLRFAAPSRRVFAAPATALASAMAAHNAAFLLGAALGESVAIFGLVYRLMGGELWVCAAFLAVGAVLVAVRFPRIEAVAAALGRAYDGVAPPAV